MQLDGAARSVMVDLLHAIGGLADRFCRDGAQRAAPLRVLASHALVVLADGVRSCEADPSKPSMNLSYRGVAAASGKRVA